MMGIMYNTTCMFTNWIQINLTTEIIQQAYVTQISREIYIKVTYQNNLAVLILFHNIVYNTKRQTKFIRVGFTVFVQQININK